jgi:hypothetical protein
LIDLAQPAARHRPLLAELPALRVPPRPAADVFVTDLSCVSVKATDCDVTLLIA